MFQLCYIDINNNNKRVFIGKPYANLNRARTRRDKLDLDYGACRYHVWDHELNRTRC